MAVAGTAINPAAIRVLIVRRLLVIVVPLVDRHPLRLAGHDSIVPTPGETTMSRP
jgi:hypothetical protein